MHITIHNRALLPHVFTLTFYPIFTIVTIGCSSEEVILLKLCYVLWLCERTQRKRLFSVALSMSLRSPALNAYSPQVPCSYKSPDFPPVDINLRAIALHTPIIYCQRETYCCYYRSTNFHNCIDIY